MRHRVKKIALGKDRKHRLSILRNLAISFIRHERIKTTQAKVKIFRPFIEKMITRAKVDNLHNRRLVFEDIKNTVVLKKLFENVAKRYLNRPGGYTRIYKLVQRVGDASQMCVIELVPEFLAEDRESGEKKEITTAPEKERKEVKETNKTTIKKNKKSDKSDFKESKAISSTD